MLIDVRWIICVIAFILGLLLFGSFASTRDDKPTIGIIGVLLLILAVGVRP